MNQKPSPKPNYDHEYIKSTLQRQSNLNETILRPGLYKSTTERHTSTV